MKRKVSRVTWEFVRQGQRYGMTLIGEPTKDRIKIVMQNCLETLKELEKNDAAEHPKAMPKG